MAGVSITLGGNFSKLDELKNKAHSTAASLKSAFGSNVGKAMFAGVAAAGAAAFAGVAAAVKKAVDAGGQLTDMMARTGAGGAGLVVMQRAFENAGMAASQVPASLNRMQKALAGLNEDGQPTNEAFQKLGLSISELISMDPVAAFQKISEAIAALPEPAQRAAMALEIFGKSGAEMLAVMSDPAAFQLAAKQVGSLGQTLEANAAKLDAVGDAFGSFETKVTQIGAEVAVALLPQLEELGKWLEETDFAEVGREVGIMASFIAELAKVTLEAAAAVAAFAEKYTLVGIIAKKLGENAPNAPGQALPVAPFEIGADGTATATKPGGKGGKTNAELAAEAAARSKAKGDANVAEKAEREAKAAEKKADAAKKEADEKTKLKAATIEEYNLESEILSARLAGDKVRLEAAEREKKIREEIKRLESGGIAAADARKPAEAKVDAEEKAAKMEEAAKEAEAKRKEAESDARGKLDDVLRRSAGNQFQSTIGAVSSMQRIGGGGGAVSSGLDYARQTADLQREANDLTRQLIELTKPAPSGD